MTLTDQEFEKIVIEKDMMSRSDLNMATMYKMKMVHGDQLSLAEVCIELELLSDFDLELLESGEAEHIPSQTSSFSNVLSPALQALVSENAQPLAPQMMQSEEMGITPPEAVSPPPSELYIKEGDEYKVISTDAEDPESVLQAAMAFYQEQAFGAQETAPEPAAVQHSVVHQQSPDPLPQAALPLGQILLEMGIIEEWQIAHAIVIQEGSPLKKFGEILLELGYATPEAILLALDQQKNRV